MATAGIFASLKQDHDNHRALIAKIEGATNPAEQADLFQQFRVEVTAHAAAEEESLYATMLGDPDLREEAQHSVSEHKTLDDDLEAVAGAEPGSEAWREGFAALKTCYLHHIDEEEEEMFPAAAEGLSDAQEQRIGEIFARRKPAEFEKAEEALGDG